MQMKLMAAEIAKLTPNSDYGAKAYEELQYQCYLRFWFNNTVRFD